MTGRTPADGPEIADGPESWVDRTSTMVELPDGTRKMYRASWCREPEAGELADVLLEVMQHA